MDSTRQIRRGMHLLSVGKIQEADRIFCTLLQQDPECVDALYGRASICLLAKEMGLAIGFAGKALQIHVKSEYYTVLGMALQEQGHAVEAQAALNSAVILNPSDARAFNALAKVQMGLGDLVQAEHSFREAVALQKGEFLYWNDLIDFYWDEKAFETALTVAQKGVEQNPGEVSFLYKLGLVLQTCDLLPEAELIFRKILHLCPEDAAAHANLGAVLFQGNQMDEARVHLERAIQDQADNVQIQVNLALVEMARGCLREARQLLWHAYQEMPEEMRIGVDLGTVLFELREIDQAHQLYDRLLATDRVHSLSGQDQCRLYYNLSTVLLAEGEFEKGWELMEFRHVLLDSFAGYEVISLWNGEGGTGSILLLRAEQGLGDTIQFIRYLPVLCQKLSVVLEVQKPLIRFVQEIVQQLGLNSQCEVLVKGEKIPERVTCQLMMMSLPYRLGMNFIPEMPLLSRFSDGFQEDMKWDLSSNIRHVGLCWAGNSQYRFDRLRSIPIHLFAPLFSVKGVEFHALQRECPETVLMEYGMHPLPDGDLLQTALLIQKLDLVITVDTVIAHLAGIMGKEVWLLNRYGGDWRWHKGSQDSSGKNLWYPSLRMFQQDQVPDETIVKDIWKPVIDRVKTALQVWVETMDEPC